MYSSLKNIQILVALLKKYNIRHIVISAGTRHTPFVCSVEKDDFFKTYSVVDERSASFFAIGMIEMIREPVAICCTSGTAAANYVSAANEAFYQQLPLLILTADRNHYYMFQQEEQMIPQEQLYSAVCKKVVTLGHVRDEKDFWYNSRICNEALMELNHGELGPVHINFIVENDYPMKQGIVTFEQETLPDIRKIERLTLEDSDEKWMEWADRLKYAKILIIYGQCGPLNEEEKQNIERFAEKYNCVISVDLLGNYHGKYTMPTYSISRRLTNAEWEVICPDYVITMNANTVSEIKSHLARLKDRFSHWHVSSKGQVSDPFKMLSDVVECSPKFFFKKFADLAVKELSEHSYYDEWKVFYERAGEGGNLNNVEIEYSSMKATQQYLKRLPKRTMLHIANSNSIRLANYFTVDESIAVYGNRGAHGIDGSMSAFVGQANLFCGLSFLLIGDLSFFYDMNSLWNQYVGNNIRIMVCNNSGGSIFHTYPNLNNVPTLDEHIAASHSTSVRAWVEYRGFVYMSATCGHELDEGLTYLMDEKINSPIILEVFTDKEVDASCIREMDDLFRMQSNSLKSKIGKVIPNGIKEVIKKAIDK